MRHWEPGGGQHPIGGDDDSAVREPSGESDPIGGDDDFALREERGTAIRFPASLTLGRGTSDPIGPWWRLRTERGTAIRLEVKDVFETDEGACDPIGRLMHD